jgi:transposase
VPDDILARRLLLPELKYVRTRYQPGGARTHLECDKVSAFEVCPKCATPSSSVYDHRVVTVKDAPLRGKHVLLHIRKRRFWCALCAKPFTEPVAGVRKGARTTERYAREVVWACENFSDLERVRRALRCSSSYLYNTLYRMLELRRRKRLYPWPRVLGIDEHCFKRARRYGGTQFVTMIVDHTGKRLFELVEGKTGAALEEALKHIGGRDNVHLVSIDLCDPFKSFVKGFFPNARIVADKFHVLRLLSPAITRRRKQLTGDRRTLELRWMLLKNGRDLQPAKRALLLQWLEGFPELRELYHAKEALHGFYRIRGLKRAERALTRMTDRWAASQLPELQTLRRTLIKWRAEILAYFDTQLTNGRVEGFNNKAKLVKRRAYGYRSFQNYRLRLLDACA